MTNMRETPGRSSPSPKTDDTRRRDGKRNTNGVVVRVFTRERDNLTCNNHAMETDGESDRLGVSKKMFKSVTVSLLFSS